LRRTDDGLNIASPDARIVQQQIRIARFGGSLLPSTHAPVEVSRPEVIDWLPETDTLVLDDRVLRQGDVYTIGADVAVPSPDQLRATTASNPPASIFFELPGDVPDEAVDIARQLVAGQPTPYDAALALQNWFRTEFEYDLDVQAGHSDDAISNFLRVRRGYCEQFAGTFAVMARAVGLPARVAVGFTPGEQLPDGTYRVLGKHAHAWAEVWFDGFGWVLFEPTPGRGAPGSEAVTGVPAAQDDTPRETGGSAGEPVPTPTTVFATPTPTTERDPLARPTPVTTVAPTTVAGSGPTGGRNVLTVFVLLGLVCGWVFGMPALVRRWTRRGGDPAAQVVDAWHGAVGVLATAGASPPAGDTPIEYARRVPHDLAFDHRALDELARLVTRAVYAPAGVGEPAALRAGVLRTQVSSSVAEVMPWRRRVVARLDPFAQRRALVGDRRRDTPHRHERVPDRAAQPTAGGTERSDELVGAS
jgi:transglutaminase-like putative cysteine protease